MSDFAGLAKDFIEEAEGLSGDKVLLLLEEYLAKGMDINATVDFDEENFWYDAGENLLNKLFMTPLVSDSSNVADDIGYNKKLIDYFLSHGFDFSRCNGLFGARCLTVNNMLTYVDFDEAINLFYSGKYLLQKGAKSEAVKCYDELEEEWHDMLFTETLVEEAMLIEGYESSHSYDLNTESLLYSYLLMLRLNRLNLPYEGIDLYTESYGKRITGIFSRSGKIKTKEINNARSLCHEITKSLYFKLNNGKYLACSVNDNEEYAEKELYVLLCDDIPKDAVDVTDKFAECVGDMIGEINIERQENTMCPLVNISTNNSNICIVS